MMQRAVILLFLVQAMGVQSQNLVPNPSFEEYSSCPDWINQIDRADYWFPVRLTPDYHNACDLTGNVSVPNSSWGGYQEAKQGEAYAGFVQNSSSGNAEAMGVQLNEPLIIGQEYYISFYVNRAPTYGGPNLSGNCWSNGQAVSFFVDANPNWPLSGTASFNNNSHLFNAFPIEDSDGWVQIIGSFVADSAYSYLAIGNFYNLDSLQIECDQEYQVYVAYYFVDCVCVSTNPSDCDELLSTRNEIIADIDIYPNPFNTEFIIEFSDQRVHSYELYSHEGALVRRSLLGTAQISQLPITNLENIQAGCYLLRIVLENGNSFHYRLLKM